MGTFGLGKFLALGFGGGKRFESVSDTTSSDGGTTALHDCALKQSMSKGRGGQVMD